MGLAASEGRVVKSRLVVSLFPGIGLLDMAFEEAGFTVVRGPDPLWGGDIKRFNLPGGVFDGVIGGPPCQKFSRLRRVFKNMPPAEDLIPEFERCVAMARPRWFVMENVEGAPLPDVPGYKVHAQMVRDDWVGGETRRARRICFGTADGVRLLIEQLALHTPEPLPAVCAAGSTWVPVRNGGSGKPKTTRGRVWGDKSEAFFHQAKVAQGLPEDFDLPPFTVRAKVKAIGNGVPLAMGRAIARAVKMAMYEEATAASA